MNEKITFSFGKNWQDYLKTVDETIIKTAGQDIDEWLGDSGIASKRVIDVGSGSGLSSLCLYRRGCTELFSFDYDQHSVDATRTLAEREGQPDNWKIMQGSVLDDELVESLGEFDIVYSWGVLHHTGAMWQAIDNASRLCSVDGTFLISLYTGGDLYAEHLALKQKFNEADDTGKNAMIESEIAKHRRWAVDRGESPDNWNRVDGRGMNTYNDIVDWLGGLPYEVAYPSEVVAYCMARGCVPQRVYQRGQGGCSVYRFQKKSTSHFHDLNIRYTYQSLTTDAPLQISLQDQIRMEHAPQEEEISTLKKRVYQQQRKEPAPQPKTIKNAFKRLLFGS